MFSLLKQPRKQNGEPWFFLLPTAKFKPIFLSQPNKGEVITAEGFEKRKVVLQQALTALKIPEGQMKQKLKLFESSGYRGLSAMPTEDDFTSTDLRPIARYENRSHHWKNSEFRSALMNLGGLFHLIQDSTVGCTEKTKAKTIAAAAEVKNERERETAVCEVGDGHSLFNSEANKVIGLSSGEKYFERTVEHSTSDNLYRPQNLFSIQDLMDKNFSDAGKLYESFDPAIAAGEPLIEVVQTADEMSRTSASETDVANKASALVEKSILSRYSIEEK